MLLCKKCAEPIELTGSELARLLRSKRKKEPTKEFMKEISKKGVDKRKKPKRY